MKVLVAEDDPRILEGLIEILETEGYEVVSASDGAQALTCYEAAAPDFVCLDIMMPKVNGYDVCRKIRETSPGVPIIFISAKSEEIDKVLGLELGADDFIIKPFGVKEVIARIRAVTRRCLATKQPARPPRPTFSMGHLQVSPDELRGQIEDRTVELSLRDVKILTILYDNVGKVISRDEMYAAGWGLKHIPNSRSLDQHISQLRKKVETDPKNPTLIRTVHGAGYRFER